MYLVTNKDVVKSVSSAEKVNKNHVVSSMLEVEAKPVEEVEIVNADTFAEALKIEGKTVYLNQSYITEEIYNYIKTFKKVPLLKSENHQIVQFLIAISSHLK
jgi:hypothetical protein